MPRSGAARARLLGNRYALEPPVNAPNPYMQERGKGVGSRLEGERGRESFVQSTLRAVPANDSRPPFQTGAVCAKHPSGRSGKRLPTPFPSPFPSLFPDGCPLVQTDCESAYSTGYLHIACAEAVSNLAHEKGGRQRAVIETDGENPGDRGSVRPVDERKAAWPYQSTPPKRGHSQ